jgi:acyl carrier protein
MANHAREEGEKIPLSEDLELFGSSGNLDSMELVALLIDIEEALMDHDIQVSLSDERAMSQSQSPFRSVQTLAAYIGTLIATAETEA